VAALALLLPALALTGCEREHSPAETRTLPLPVQVLADTSASTPLRVEPPEARIWVRTITEASGGRPPVADIAPAPASGSGPALPDAAIDSIAPMPAPPPLDVPADLEPPIPKRSARLVMPERRRIGREGATVELDLLIEENGEVADVEWASGSQDSSLVAAAIASARTMSFYPALRRGHPVAVWCRQRFDFGGR
jgi:TonB family protein